MIKFMAGIFLAILFTQRRNQKMNVLITTSPYTTLLYFLVNDLQDIKSSACFFIRNRHYSSEERKKITSIMPKSYFLIESPLRIRFRGNALTRRLYTALQLVLRRGIPYVFLRVSKKFRWSFLNTAEIFAYDNSPTAAALIGRRDYTFLEEGLFTYQNADRFANNNSLDLRLQDFCAKPFGIRGLAANSQAKRIILTGLAEIPECYSKKNLDVVSMLELWKESGRDKQEFIMKFFELEASDVEAVKSKDIILVDQPLADDGLMTKAEQIELVRRILDHYGASNVLLKTHYRNSINYRAVFPDVMVWDKFTPMELLTFCGVKFREAVTVNSTAVLTLPSDVKIEWLGIDTANSFFDHLSEPSSTILRNFINSIPTPNRIQTQERSTKL